MLTANITGNSIIKVACSIDSGQSWWAFYNSIWTNISIGELKIKGMTSNIVNTITETQWSDLVNDKQSIRFMYYIEKLNIDDECSIKSIRLNYK